MPYDSSPVWTADPKNQVFSQASKRALPLPASARRREGCNRNRRLPGGRHVRQLLHGTKDAKSAISDCERQLKRIYR